MQPDREKAASGHKRQPTDARRTRPARRRGGARWAASTPRGEPLTIERDLLGRWTVLLGGFSRSVQHSLLHALAEATGEHRDAPWLNALAQEIEADAG